MRATERGTAIHSRHKRLLRRTCTCTTATTPAPLTAGTTTRSCISSPPAPHHQRLATPTRQLLCAASGPVLRAPCLAPIIAFVRGLYTARCSSPCLQSARSLRSPPPSPRPVQARVALQPHHTHPQAHGFRHRGQARHAGACRYIRSDIIQTPSMPMHALGRRGLGLAAAGGAAGPAALPARRGPHPVPAAANRAPAGRKDRSSMHLAMAGEPKRGAGLPCFFLGHVRKVRNLPQEGRRPGGGADRHSTTMHHACTCEG